MDHRILKTLTITAGSRSNPVTHNVNLNGILPIERLTPKMAEQAARIGFGHCHGITVWDNDFNYGYRLYGKSARKLYHP